MPATAKPYAGLRSTKIREKDTLHSRDKIVWSDFERTQCGPKGERQEAWSNAGIFFSRHKPQKNEIPAFAGMT